jgi:glycosyltransferase involved in cell wall biosynthesis
MNKPSALVLITPGFPSDEQDTTCLPFVQIAVKAFQQADPFLKVIVLAHQYPFFQKTYQWNETSVTAFGGAGKGKFSRLYSFFRVWLKIFKLNREYRIVGLLSLWLDKSAFIGSVSAKIYKLPHFCWLLGQDAKAGNMFVKLIKPKAGSLIANSDFIAEEFNRNYQILPKQVIPVGIDTMMFGSELQERDIDILGVGSLIPLKQFHLFLAVIKQLVTVFPNIKAVICGAGPELDSLKKLTQDWNLKANISLKGELPHPKVLKLMGRSKVLLHTSSYEGFAMVGLEALYAGAKVISFVRPMREKIENWSYVNTLEEMIAVTAEILNDTDIIYKKVLPFSTSYSAQSILKLYHYKTDTIS